MPASQSCQSSPDTSSIILTMKLQLLIRINDRSPSACTLKFFVLSVYLAWYLPSRVSFIFAYVCVGSATVRCMAIPAYAVCVFVCVCVHCGACLTEAWVLPSFDRGNPQIRSKSGPKGMPASVRGKWNIFTATKSASIWPQRAPL